MPERSTMAVLEDDNNSQKPLQPKVYEAKFVKYDGENETRYYQADRLIEAATQADDVVKDDAFTTLTSVVELGPLN